MNGKGEDSLLSTPIQGGNMLTSPSDIHIDQVLKLAVDKDCSDVHIKVGVPPTLRIHRELHLETTFPAMTPEDTKNFLHEITTEEQRQTFYRNWELDFAYSAPEIGRFRVNAYLQVGTVSMVFRWVRTKIPTMEQLGLPEVCRELAMKRDGMVILTGPTGCGKSTTLAAMLDFMNATMKRNIITVEDPIEFLHDDKKCTFSQREVGVDTHSFADALKHVLRQDPDVILVGEMRDVETMATALTAAETGHLILSTAYSQFLRRYRSVCGCFSTSSARAIRLQLSTTLQGVLYQVLIPKSDETGVIPGVEVLIATPAIKNLIREGKTFQMPNFMHTGQDVGMQTLDQALIDMHRTGKIKIEECMVRLHSTESLNQAGSAGLRVAKKVA
jgi:twitching motility protein PilT